MANILVQLKRGKTINVCDDCTEIQVSLRDADKEKVVFITPDDLLNLLTILGKHKAYTVDLTPCAPIKSIEVE